MVGLSFFRALSRASKSPPRAACAACASSIARSFSSIGCIGSFLTFWESIVVLLPCLAKHQVRFAGLPCEVGNEPERREARQRHDGARVPRIELSKEDPHTHGKARRREQ